MGTCESNERIRHKHQVWLRPSCLGELIPIRLFSLLPSPSVLSGSPELTGFWGSLAASHPAPTRLFTSGMKVRHLLSIFPHCLAEARRPRFPTHKSLLIWTALGHAGLFTQRIAFYRRMDSSLLSFRPGLPFSKLIIFLTNLRKTKPRIHFGPAFPWTIPKLELYHTIIKAKGTPEVWYSSRN